MPATYTHHIFTKDVFKVLNEDIKNKISCDKDIFDLFGKSFDILFFIKPKLGRYAHNNEVNRYFEEIIRYVKDYNLVNDSQVLAYLYGSICHYVLDSIVHPYVYYKTGKYIRNNRDTYKYKGKHSYLEYMIDAIIYQDRNNKKIYKNNIAKEVFPKLRFKENLNKTLNAVYQKVFKVNNACKLIFRGYKNYKLVVKYIMSSYFGIKPFIYKLIDATNLIRNFKLRNKTYWIKKIDYSVLNLEHRKWCYPTDKNITYHYSFYDLYDIAIERARTLINLLDDTLINDDIDIKNFLKELGDISYYTGKKVNKHSPMKYFEF